MSVVAPDVDGTVYHGWGGADRSTRAKFPPSFSVLSIDGVHVLVRAADVDSPICDGWGRLDLIARFERPGFEMVAISAETNRINMPIPTPEVDPLVAQI